MAKKTKNQRHLAPARYSEQIVLLISRDARAVIEIACREEGLSQAAAARAFLYAGMKAAGYKGLRTTDELDNEGRAQHAAKMIQGMGK